jgi:branched-chain amino acid transport system permease protein
MSNPKKQGAAIATAGVLVALGAPLFIENEYYLHTIIRLFLNMLVATGLYTIMRVGLVSFAHTAFMAIGGYTSALMVMKLGLNSWSGLICALLITSACAYIFGMILLRLKGTYFLIASFAFAELVILLFSQIQKPFGGAGGLMNIPLPTAIPLLGAGDLVFSTKRSFYYLALVFLLVPLYTIHRVEKSRIGEIWAGIQQSDLLAKSVGINIMAYKTVAFVLGSVLAALGGTFIGHYSSHLSPGQFDAFQLLNYLTFVMIGGSKKLIGPLIGATLLTLLGEWLALFRALSLYQSIIYGLVLIIVVLFLPDGLISLRKGASNPPGIDSARV